MDILMAPMQGYADDVYIKWHRRIYGDGVSEYFSPFVRIEGGEPRRRDMQRLIRCRHEGADITPQIIFDSVAEFDALVAAIKDAGYRRIDLNLGCPYPMQTGKRRGSAMIANAEVMKRVAERIANDTGEAEYSVKMRLGLKESGEWRSLMPILNDVKLRHITVHPRVARQMYKGELYMDEFAHFCSESANPVVYNGDILSVGDLLSISAEYPMLHAVMVGRGLLGRPSLAAEWAEGEEWPAEKRIAALRRLHDALFTDYEASLCGPVQILQHIKPFWEYLEPEIGHKIYKAIRKSSSLDAYRKAVEMVR